MLKNAKLGEVVTKTTKINQMNMWYKNPDMAILLTYMESLRL